MADQSSKELRHLRQEFQATAQAAVKELDKRIHEAEKAEAEATAKALIKQFTSTGSLDDLQGHEFIFLISNAKSMGHGPESFLAAALDTVYELNVVAGKDAEISALFWGYKGRPDGIYLENRESVQSKYLNSAKADSKEFLPVAKHILNENTPDKQTGKQRHYIVIGDGNCTDNPEYSAAILTAVGTLNPTATLDFIACGKHESNPTNCAYLAICPDTFSTNLSTTAIKAYTHDDVVALIKAIMKARLEPCPSTDVYLPMSPPPRVAC